MKTKSFRKYLEKRLSAEDIATIRAQAELEVKALRFIQKFITDTIDSYMKENNIGFNELVRRLDWSPSKVAKIQRGEANLTMASMAHLFALLGKTPQEVFKNLEVH
jgi:transcriptional regulator with XRE-family HTH domain